MPIGEIIEPFEQLSFQRLSDGEILTGLYDRASLGTFANRVDKSTQILTVVPAIHCVC